MLAVDPCAWARQLPNAIHKRMPLRPLTIRADFSLRSYSPPFELRLPSVELRKLKEPIREESPLQVIAPVLVMRRKLRRTPGFVKKSHRSDQITRESMSDVLRQNPLRR